MKTKTLFPKFTFLSGSVNVSFLIPSCSTASFTEIDKHYLTPFFTTQSGDEDEHGKLIACINFFFFFKCSSKRFCELSIVSFSTLLFWSCLRYSATIIGMRTWRAFIWFWMFSPHLFTKYFCSCCTDDLLSDSGRGSSYHWLE